MRLEAGGIVLVDWRDALPLEASKRGRPAVVVEDRGLFHEDYPNVILVPLAEDPHLAAGLNVSDGKIRNLPVAEALGLPYFPLAA